MAGFRNKLENQQKVIFFLMGLQLIWAAAFFNMASAIKSLPDEITVDVPPDLNMGITRKLGERDPYQVHGYALLFHDTINNWSELEDRDKLKIEKASDQEIKTMYPYSLIEDFRCLVTPEFQRELLLRRANYIKSGEYIGQARYSRLIVSKGFADINTYKIGADWVVDLPVNQTEYYKGKKLYTRDISFKYRIVEGESRAINCNGKYWNFQVAGYYEEPKQIHISAAE